MIRAPIMTMKPFTLVPVLLTIVLSTLAACSKPAAPTAAPTVEAAVPARELPPVPGEPRSAAIPAPAEKTLANGLRVILVPRNGNPLVTAQLDVLSGGEVDPPQLSGLADFTANLLTQGTRTLSAPQIAQTAEALGGSITAVAAWNATHIGITVTTPKIDAALALLGDVVQNPVFAKTEVDRQRAQAIDALSVNLSQPGMLATLTAARLVYGTSVYGHPRLGTPAALGRIKPADLLALHKTWYRPDNAVLIFAGDLDADAAFALAEKTFGKWAKPDTALAQAASASDALAQAGKLVVVDLPGAGQAAVVAVQRTEPRSAADYYAGLITNAVLGGGYSARLNEEIRIKRGLSYGASSRFQALRDAGALFASAQTKNESAAQVVELIRTELTKLSTEDVPVDELKARKASLIGGFSRGLETTEGLAGQIGDLTTFGIDLGEINHTIDRANAVTPDQIRTYASAHLAPANTSVVVAGDAKQFIGELRKKYPDLVLITADKLDLDSATLGLPPAASTP